MLRSSSRIHSRTNLFSHVTCHQHHYHHVMMNNTWLSRFSHSQSHNKSLSERQYDIKSIISELNDSAFAMTIPDIKRAISTLESNVVPYIDECHDDNHHIHLQDLYVNTVQKLMSRCAHLANIDGAECSERLLSMVLHHRARDTKHNEDGSDVAAMDFTGSTIHPTKQMFTIAIEAWANVKVFPRHNYTKSSLPAERAAQILDYMWEEYHQTQLSEKESSGASIKPDVIHYTSVFQAYANSLSKKSVHNALDLLRKLEQKSGVDALFHPKNESKFSLSDLDPNLVPDRACYNTILHCLSRYHRCRNDVNEKYIYSHSYIVGEMNNVIQKMEKLARKFNDDIWMPNTRSYNLLLMAQNDGKEAEAILMNMLNKAESLLTNDDYNNDSTGVLQLIGDFHTLQEESILPNVKSYNAVLNISDPNRAQEILVSMLLENRSSFHKKDITNHPILTFISPDIVSFNTVISKWAENGDSNAGEKAECLLRFMEGKSKSLLGISPNAVVKRPFQDLNGVSFSISPDLISFNMTIKAWINSGSRDAIERAEKILYKMIENDDVEESKSDITAPTHASFSMVMNAWAHSNRSDCGEKAQAIFDRMPISPNDQCCKALILAWCNQTTITQKAEYYDKALNLVREMYFENNFTVDTDLVNKVLSIPSVVSKESESSKYDMVCKVIQLFRDVMNTCQSDGVLDVYSFNHVIKALFDFKSEEFQSDAFFASIDMFNSLCENKTLAPNSQTYICMFKILQQYLDKDVIVRSAICEDLFRKCCESGLLTNAVLRIIEKLLPQRSLSRLEACRINDGNGPLTVYELPSDWSKNRRVGQNQTRNRKRK